MAEKMGDKGLIELLLDARVAEQQEGEELLAAMEGMELGPQDFRQALQQLIPRPPGGPSRFPCPQSGTDSIFHPYCLDRGFTNAQAAMRPGTAARSRRMSDWVVLLEYGAAADRSFDVGTVEDLVDHLSEWNPIGLYHPDRYALQLHIPAVMADEALRVASALHEEALTATGATASFIRAEVLTQCEFEESWHKGVPTVVTEQPSPGTDALVCAEVYDATRALLGATSVSGVTDIVVGFVLAIGGSVHVGQRRDVPGMVSMEVSISPGQVLYAMAESVSVPGLILERWLPPLLDDARRRLQKA